MKTACIKPSRIICKLQQLIVVAMLMFAVAIPHALANEAKTQQQPLVMCIHPYKSAASLIKMYKPLASYLSRKTGQRFKIVITKDYDSHIKSIGEDKVAIAYMGPASYIDLVKRYGKKPLLARQAIHGNPTFQGKIIVRDNSPFNVLSDLSGKRFAFGDHASTMSHLVPRHMLRQAGVTIKQLAKYGFLGSHDNVALAVLSGDYDAGAIKEAVFEKYQPRGLKALASTPAISEHLFVTSTKLSDELQQSLRKALYNLKNDAEGQNIMNNIKTGMTAWIEVSDTDYDNLRVILDTLTEAGIQP